jgi:hypothetical protein
VIAIAIVAIVATEDVAGTIAMDAIVIVDRIGNARVSVAAMVDVKEIVIVTMGAGGKVVASVSVIAVEDAAIIATSDSRSNAELLVWVDRAVLAFHRSRHQRVAAVVTCARGSAGEEKEEFAVTSVADRHHPLRQNATAMLMAIVGVGGMLWMDRLRGRARWHRRRRCSSRSRSRSRSSGRDSRRRRYALHMCEHNFSMCV